VGLYGNKEKRMKKVYSINLDIEPAEKVKAHLETMGQSFSGFFNILVNEYASELKAGPGKKISEMTVGEFWGKFSKWYKLASGE